MISPEEKDKEPKDCEPILIKKYSNRRLYNTAEKKYITLEQLAQMIQKGYKVKVIENQTGEDITQETLLQIILSVDKGPKNLFSSSFLHQLICFQEEHLQEFLQSYLGTMIESFSKFKQNMTQQLNIWGQMWSLGLPHKLKNKENTSDSEHSEDSAKQDNGILHNIETRLSEYEKKIHELEEKLREKESGSSENDKEK